MSRSSGTKYENFIHDYVEDNQKKIYGGRKISEGEGLSDS